MKYRFDIFNSSFGINETITISANEGFTNFPAVVGNSNYDQFLVQVDLTDKQVHALTPDVWYDFHEGTV